MIDTNISWPYAIFDFTQNALNSANFNIQFFFFTSTIYPATNWIWGSSSSNYDLQQSDE